MHLFRGKMLGIGCRKNGFLFLVLFFLLPGIGMADSLDALVKKARDLRLAEDSYWHVLYHYHVPLGGGFKSRIDDSRFFFSPEGKENPQAEMEAAIHFLFSGQAENPCLYIARHHWLHVRLQAEEEGFPQPFCPDLANIHPASARLVFPAYFMNSPASMFGHTLMTLRMDNSARVLDKAVNYEAHTRETNGFVFAFKGIFGFYPGFFNVLPYYKKIQEYGEINQRDIWEYRLDLAPHEMDAMVRHIREMEGVSSDYFFFDENCSFTLMYLVEAARPGLDLTDTFPLWVIPVDTVRALQKEGLIVEAEYQPSRATIIRHRLSLLSPEDQDLAFEILEGKKSPETVQELETLRAIRVLDTVIDCIRYQFVKKKMDQKAYQKTLIHALRVRSRMGLADTLPPVPIPRRPDTLHGSSRMALGVQVVDGRTAMSLAYRPAFTDLTDPDYPESDGIRIVFGETRLRLGPEGEGAQLESFDAIDIVSLSPRDRFFTPLSWAAGAGLEGIPGEKRGRLLRLGGGAGFSWGGGKAGLVYLMGMPRFFAGSGLENGHSLGAVMRIGWILRLFGNSKWQIFTEGGGFALGQDGYAAAAGLEGSLRLGVNWHLGISALHQQRWEQSELRTLLALHWFH